MLPLEAALMPKLRALGFRKNGLNWWRDENDVIEVIKLDKSDRSDHLFINLGVYLIVFGEAHSPPEEDCHIRASLEDIAHPDYRDFIDNAEAIAEPAPELIDAVVKEGVGWLSFLSTKEGRDEFLLDDLSDNCYVHRSLRGI